MNNFHAVGSESINNVAVSQSAAASPAPIAGALVRIAGEADLHGWILIDDHAPGAGTRESQWAALVPFESTGNVWTGIVDLNAVTIEVADPPAWWSSQTENLMRSLINAARARTVLVEDAHRWADDNSLCGVFDSFMRDHELPPRRREYTAPASVTLTMELPVPVTARHGEDASALVDSDLIEQALRQRLGGLRRYGIIVGDYTVGDLQENTG